MKVIYKYQIDEPAEGSSEVSIDMPKASVMRHVDFQDQRLHVWAEVFPDLPLTPRTFRIFGTGDPLDIPATGWTFVGTAWVGNHELVFHVYVKNED